MTPRPRLQHRETLANRQPYLPGQEAFPSHATGFQLEASPQSQLDQHAAPQARRDAVVPEGGVALQQEDTS